MANGYVIKNERIELSQGNITVNTSSIQYDTKQLDQAVSNLQVDTETKLLDVSIHDVHQYVVIYGAIIIIAMAYGIRWCRMNKESSMAGENVRA